MAGRARRSRGPGRTAGACAKGERLESRMHSRRWKGPVFLRLDVDAHYRPLRDPRGPASLRYCSAGLHVHLNCAVDDAVRRGVHRQGRADFNRAARDGDAAPFPLALSIPSALLIALLIAFGRLSADREFVAMQACGISVARLLRPVAFISLLGWVATSYVMLEALPDANQAFREIAYNVLAQRAEGEVKPRVFFDE